MFAIYGPLKMDFCHFWEFQFSHINIRFFRNLCKEATIFEERHCVKSVPIWTLFGQNAGKYEPETL